MDELILQVLQSLDSGGCIYRYSTYAEVYPIYSGCRWDAYAIDLDLFWTMYMAGLITEHYDPETLQFDFFDISDSGFKTLHPVPRQSWEMVNGRWTVVQ